MGSLLAPAQTPWYFLVGSGLVMVIALATSKKAHNVVKTSLDLSRQSEGNEASVHRRWHVCWSVLAIMLLVRF